MQDIDQNRKAYLLRWVTRASLATAIVLTLTKAVAWWLSGSVSLLAGLTDSVMDGAASLLNLLAVHYALRPADDDHRYGHGKAEALAALGQSIFIAVSAVLVAIQAVERLQHPQGLEAPLIGIGVMVLSLVLTILLLLFQNHVIRVTGSTAVRADALHYRSDLFLNTSILIALVLDMQGWQGLDPIFGLGISVYILWSAYSIAHDAGGMLMDTQLDDDVIERMREAACSVPQVMGVHDMRARGAGTYWFVQLHLELPANMTLAQAHVCCDEAELAIRKIYPQAEVLVHADPYDPETRRLVDTAQHVH